MLVVRGLATQQSCRPIRLGECSDGEHRGCCPEKTGEFVRAKLKDSRIRILTHEKNQGVGGAVMTGYKAAIAEGKRPFSTNPSILFKMKNYSQKEIKKVVSIDKTHMKGP